MNPRPDIRCMSGLAIPGNRHIPIIDTFAHLTDKPGNDCFNSAGFHQYFKVHAPSATANLFGDIGIAALVYRVAFRDNFLLTIVTKSID